MSYKNFTTAGIKLDIDVKDAFKGVEDTSSFLNKQLKSMELHADSFSDKWGDMTRGIKDTKRIVSGIMISQAFYTLSSAVAGVTSEILDFSANMESASISMEYFIKNAEGSVNTLAKSQAYLRELNRFAARTPFSTEQTLQLSRYMQAMGMGIETTKSFFGVMADAAAATGGTEDQLNRAVIAMGRMQAKGRITSREIRQLAAANIPIYEILREELNLTGEQVAKLGDQWIGAEEAMTGILRGLEKRYEGAADRMADTYTGMANIIKDNIKIIGQVGGASLFEGLTGGMMKLRNALQEYREIAIERGAGGLFHEMLINIDTTGELGTKILTLIGTLTQLGSTLKATYISAKPLRELLGNTLYASVITISNAIIGMSKAAAGAMKGLERLGISGYNAANILASLYITYKVGSWLGFMGQAAIKGAWALIETAKATSLILPAALQARAGIAALTMGISGLIVYGLAARGVFKSISSTLAGLNTEATGGNILPDSYMKEFEDYQERFKEYNDAIDEYKDAFDAPYSEMGDGADEAVDGFDKIKDASSKAAKAVKNDWLASFDEVYTIPRDTAGNSIVDDLLDSPDFGLGLTPPVFKFPKIESIEIKSPKLNISDVFGDSPWDDINADGIDKSWLKKTLPVIALLTLQRALAPFAKHLQTARDKKGGLGETKGATSGVLNMTKEELLAAIDDVGNKLVNRITQIDGLMEQIKSGQLVPRDLEIAVKLLDEANTKALKELEKLNELNFLVGKETKNISAELEAATKVIKENQIAKLGKDIASIKSLIQSGDRGEDITTRLNKLNKMQAQYDELVGNLAMSMPDHLNKLNDAYVEMVKSVASKADADTQLKLIKDFNTEMKTVNKLLQDMGEIKLDTKYTDILKTTNRIEKIVIDYNNKLSKYAELIKLQDTYREDRTLLMQGGEIINATEIASLNRNMKDIGEQIVKLRKGMEAPRIILENSVDEIRIAREEAATRELERRKASVAEAKAKAAVEAAEEKRSKAEIKAREKATKIIDDTKSTLERTQEILNENNALRELEEAAAPKYAEELAANKADLAEAKATLAEIQKVFYDVSSSAPTDKDLIKLARDFGIEQKLSTATLVEAYTTRMDDLKDQIADLEGAIKLNTFTPTKPLTAKDIVDAYMSALREGTPVMPTDRLPSNDYIDTMPDALKKLYEGSEALSHAFTATGTKMLTLSKGIGEYGNSLPEIFANILKDNYENLMPNLTSREFTPFLELVSNLGVELEEHVIYAAKDKVAKIGELFRSESSISTADKSLITQIDAFIDTLAGGIIPTDIKTISVDMSEKLWEAGQLSIDMIEKYKAEWFHQFAAQVYTMTQGKGGDFGLITFNRDYDFGSVIAKRFHEAFNVGEFGNIFNPDVIKKATRGKTDAKAIKAYIAELQEKVFFDVFSQTIDMSPLKDAINAGTIHYSKELLDEMRIPHIIAAWRQYTNMLATVMDGSGIENFLNTFVEFETTLDDMVFPVNVASIPRVYTKAGNSLNKWLQTVLDNPDIKMSGTFKSDGKEVQKLIDKIINDFNKTLDVDTMTTKLTILKRDIEKVLAATQDAFKPLEIADLSKEFNHVTGLLKGTTSDFRNLIDGLDAVIGKPGTVEHTGRILRSAIERTNTINRNIADGLEVSASELYAVKRNLETLASQFGTETDLVYRTTIRYLNDLMAEIKLSGDAAILDVSTAIKLPFKTLGVEEALAYAAGEIRRGITEGMIKFQDILTADASLEAFDEAIKHITPKNTDKIYPAMERLTGAFKGLVVDIEATGIDLREAIVAQIAVLDTDTGETTTMFINRGHKQNKQILAAMQDIRDKNTPFYEYVETQMDNIVDKAASQSASVERIARELENTPDPHKYLPEFLQKYKEVISDITKSVPDIRAEMLDWAELTDVAKVWRTVSVEMLDAGYTIKEAGEYLKRAIEDMPVEWYGHNLAEYDLMALSELFPDIDFTQYADTLKLARQAFEGISFAAGDMDLKLVTLYETLTGKSSEMAHMADNDIQMTYELLKLFDSGFVDKVASAVKASQEAGATITADAVSKIASDITNGVASGIGKAAETASVSSEVSQATETFTRVFTDIITNGMDDIMKKASEGYYGYRATIPVDGSEPVGYMGSTRVDTTKPVDYTLGAKEFVRDLGHSMGVPEAKIDEAIAAIKEGTKAQDIFRNIGGYDAKGAIDPSIVFPGFIPTTQVITESEMANYLKTIAERVSKPASPEIPKWTAPEAGDWSRSGDPELLTGNWFKDLFSKATWDFTPTDAYAEFRDLTSAVQSYTQYLSGGSMQPGELVRQVLSQLPPGTNVLSYTGEAHEATASAATRLAAMNRPSQAGVWDQVMLKTESGEILYSPDMMSRLPKNFTPLTLEDFGFAEGMFSGRTGTAFSKGFDFSLPENIGKFKVPFGGQDYRFGRFAHEATPEGFWDKAGGSGVYRQVGDAAPDLLRTSNITKVLGIAGDALRLINVGTQIHDLAQTQIEYSELALGLTKVDDMYDMGGLAGLLGAKRAGYEKTGPGFETSIIRDRTPDWVMKLMTSPEAISHYKLSYGDELGIDTPDPETYLGPWIDMASPIDKLLKGLTFGLGSTRSGTANTLNEYFDMGPEDRMYWGAKYISGGDTGLSGLLGALMGRGVSGVIKNRTVYDPSLIDPTGGHYQIGSKTLSKEDYILAQMGTGSQFDALATHILTSGDTDSKTAKKFYKQYGDYMDTFKLASGMDDSWTQAAQILLDGMGPEINESLAQAGISPVEKAGDIDLSLKGYFDSIMEAMHTMLIDSVAGKLAIDREHTSGYSLSDAKIDRVFESTRMDNLPVGALNMLQEELGITISKINDEFGKVSFDTSILTEELSGWTKRLPEGINLTSANLTPKDVSILAQAGIQVNGDGTVTFMKAPVEAMSGTSRDLSITLDDMSKSVLSKLSASGITVGLDGSLDLGADELSKKMTSALFKTNTSLTGKVSEDMKQALSGLGSVLDSGYIEITNTAVLNGSMTIAEYIGSMGDKANELSPKVLETLLALDEVIAQGGEATALSVATWADGIVMPSPIDAEALTPEIEAAFAAVGITFADSAEGFKMVINKLGDDLSDGVTLIPKEMWDQLDEDIILGLEALGVTLTEQGGYVKVDLTTTLRELVDVEEITPAIETAMDQLGAVFVVEGGKIVGVTDKQGNDLTDGMLKISDRILSEVDPATLKALQALGVTIEEVNEETFLNFTGMTESGIEDIVELYVNRPDLWDKIPDSIRDVLIDANLMNNEGMLTIKTDMLGMLVKVGEDWVGNWDKLPPATQKALGLTDKETKDGLFKITKTTEDADIDGLLEGQVIVPFSELPQEIKDKMVGPGGVDAELANSYFIIEGTTEAGMASMFDAVRIGFDDAAGEAGRGAASIAESVKQAMRDIANMESVTVKKSYVPFVNKDKPKWTKDKTGHGYTVRYGGNTYSAPNARTISEAQQHINERYGILIPQFKKGGLITGDGLYRAGEFNRTEAVLPLEDPAAMAQVGAAIAAFMPFSNVFDIGAATQGALVGRINTVLTARAEIDMDFQRELHETKLEIFGEASEKSLEAAVDLHTLTEELINEAISTNEILQNTIAENKTAVNDVMSGIRENGNLFTSSLRDATHSINDAIRNTTSMVQSSARDIISAIQSSSGSISSAIGDITLGDGSRTSSSDSHSYDYYDYDDDYNSRYDDYNYNDYKNDYVDKSPQNKLGMSDADFHNYVMFKKYAQEEYDRTGKWNKDLNRQAQALRDKYGIGSDDYSYNDLKNYIGSARGSLVTKDALYRAGEGGLNEAIIPLERPQIMERVGRSIASFMPDASRLQPAMGMQDAGVRRISQAPAYAPQQHMSEDMIAQRVLEVVLPAMASRSEGESNLRPMYVGTLVADDRGLKELNKKMKVIEASEKKRGVR